MIDFAKILRGFAAAQSRILRQQGHAAGRRFPASQGVIEMSAHEELRTNEPGKAKEMTTMSSNALAEVQDGFEGFEGRVEGDDRAQQAGGIIQGTLVKFTNEAKWITRDDGAELPLNRELTAIGITRVAQKWIDQRPAETIILAPGQKFPDVAKLNAEVPRSEWREGPSGDLVGPWQIQFICYLLDPTTMERFTYPTGTIGGGICVRDLADKVKWMRQFKGAHVYPVVTLADVPMRTKYGGRARPHFKIVRWVILGSEGKVLPAPTAEKVAPQSELRTVETPSLSEQMGGDKVPY